MTETRYGADELKTCTMNLLVRAGLPAEPAGITAEVLVEGDLMGKTTHGLQLMTPYLTELENGGLVVDGQPKEIADTGAAFTWDGRYMSGPWLVSKAMDEAERRVGRHGVVTAVIRKTHHIGALQAYLARATGRNLMMILMASDPREESVAPHGGIVARYSPNPIAVGIPTSSDPILIDVSVSTTANGVVNRAHKEGRRLPGPWLKDAQGNPRDDPGVRFTDPPGALYPLGGPDLGYKGFGLGVMIEALTNALGGFGRADRPTNWGATVFLQLIDPACFGGTEAFLRENDFLAEFCRSTPVAAGDPPVQMPGDGALRRRREQLEKGVLLYPGIIEALGEWAEKYNVGMPVPLPGGR